MALNICLEAIIRLFFEVIRVLFGDVTIIFKSANIIAGLGEYFYSQTPALVSTLKWIFIFILVSMLSKNELLKKMIILGIPFLVGLLSYIPFIGGYLAVGAGILTMRIVVISWVFVLWSDERVHPLLRAFATPGVMIIAALNAVFPYTSVFGNLGYAFLTSYAPEVAAFLFVVIMGLLFILTSSWTWLCELVNFVLIKWETIRYEGWAAAIFGCLVFIRNKVVNVKYYLK
ncbi:MAG: hypothetical protein Q8O03_01685 [Nanoarchaeota archaeon]|nr:hypothetical protein [Nanoarchaeota archaeon]